MRGLPEHPGDPLGPLDDHSTLSQLATAQVPDLVRSLLPAPSSFCSQHNCLLGASHRQLDLGANLSQRAENEYQRNQRSTATSCQPGS